MADDGSQADWQAKQNACRAGTRNGVNLRWVALQLRQVDLWICAHIGRGAAAPRARHRPQCQESWRKVIALPLCTRRGLSIGRA